MRFSSINWRVLLLMLVALTIAVRATAQVRPAATLNPPSAVNVAAAPPVSQAPNATPQPAATSGNSALAILPANNQGSAPASGASSPQTPTHRETTGSAQVPNAAANTTTSAYDPSTPMIFPQGTPIYVTPTMPATNNGGVLQIQGLQGETVPWSIVVLLTVLTLIPSILLCVTPFARLLIVFHFLRQALGLQTTPSNQTLIGLSLILTFFLMQPVGMQIYETAIVPMQGGQISAMEALGRGEEPMRKFMTHYVREKDVALFVELAKEPRPATIDDVSMRVLLPAYILSELKAGFQIGTILFLPFLIVDMVVASITTSVGMLQLPPVVISTPLKLLLFLMVDGWHLLVGSLMRSFS